MKINNVIAILASVIALSAGLSSCADEPEMVTAPAHTEKAAIATPDNTLYDGKDAPCTIHWSVDEGVESVTVNGKLYDGQGSIKAKVGQSISWEATAKPDYQFTSPGHNTFKVEAGAEGGVIYIPISTQKWNF